MICATRNFQWRTGGAGEVLMLRAGGYVNSLRLAREHGIRTIAFPAISCGVSRYPSTRG